MSYPHGPAQNGDIITQFMCDTLVNACGADQTARDTCAAAKVAFDSKPAKTGAQADAFNAIFGIQTKFASVAAVDNQGNIIAGTAVVDGSAGSGSDASSEALAPTSTTAPAATTDAASSTTVRVILTLRNED